MFNDCCMVAWDLVTGYIKTEIWPSRRQEAATSRSKILIYVFTVAEGEMYFYIYLSN